jgi:hypothetical protein
MKKLLSSLAVIALCAMMFTSCNSNSPKKVADKWLTSFYHMDYKGAKELSTEKTKGVLDMLEQLGTMVADSQKQNAQKIKINVKDVKEEGDKATVTYTISEDNQDKTIHLIKENGKWLVNYTKQDDLDEDAANEGDVTEEPAMSDTAAPPPADGTTTEQSAADTAMKQ